MHADDNDSIGGGLYIGPMLLAAFLAGSVYRTMCESRGFVPSIIDGTPFAPVFAAFAIWLAFKVRTNLERAAWLAFASSFVVGTLTWISAVRAPSWSGWLIALAAVLLTAVGLRSPTKDKVAIAAGLFALVFTGIFLAQRYGAQLGGRSTVFAVAPFCA
jgi:hypothetical protein